MNLLPSFLLLLALECAQGREGLVEGVLQNVQEGVQFAVQGGTTSTWSFIMATSGVESFEGIMARINEFVHEKGLEAHPFKVYSLYH